MAAQCSTQSTALQRSCHTGLLRADVRSPSGELATSVDLDAASRRSYQPDQVSLGLLVKADDARSQGNVPSSASGHDCTSC